mmetsp:Transcript_16902/g.49226  ORF Transcript_16902/g.49226 Transcript_16902/m.49226 type:complete len:227 (-) Transcript_16902:2574-3254(-)
MSIWSRLGEEVRAELFFVSLGFLAPSLRRSAPCRYSHLQLVLNLSDGCWVFGVARFAEIVLEVFHGLCVELQLNLSPRAAELGLRVARSQLQSPCTVRDCQVVLVEGGLGRGTIAIQDGVQCISAAIDLEGLRVQGNGRVELLPTECTVRGLLALAKAVDFAQLIGAPLPQVPLGLEHTEDWFRVGEYLRVAQGRQVDLRGFGRQHQGAEKRGHAFGLGRRAFHRV